MSRQPLSPDRTQLDFRVWTYLCMKELVYKRPVNIWDEQVFRTCSAARQVNESDILLTVSRLRLHLDGMYMQCIGDHSEQLLL